MTDFAAARKPADDATTPDAGAQGAVSPITRALSEYIATALARPLPAEVAEKTKHHLLDTLAAMVSGSRPAPGRRALAYVRAQGGSRQATVAGSRCVTSAVNAALANGMSAHADESDDSHDARPLPSRLRGGAGGARGGRAGGPRRRQPAARGSARLRHRRALRARARDLARLTAGRTAPTAWAACSAQPPRPAHCSASTRAQIRFQLSYIVQQASGLAYWMRDPDHIEKAFDFGGMPARNGVAAATMVAAGFTGVEDPLAARAPISMRSPRRRGPRRWSKALGSRFEIIRASIKKWTSGSPIQAALDALESLMREHGIGAGGCAALTVRLPDDRIHLVDDSDMPNLCVQHLLAVMLLDGRLGFHAVHDQARHARPEGSGAARAHPRGARCRADPGTAAAPGDRQGHDRDGRGLEERARAVRGTPDNPMARHEVEAKAQDLLATGARQGARACAHRSGPADRGAALHALAAAAAAGVKTVQGRTMPPLTWIVWPVM